MPQTRAAQAFTLVELLVVIAIVALPASLLFPVLGRAQNRAKLAQCLNNLRQLSLGFEHHLDDNGDRFPPIPGNWNCFQCDGGDPDWKLSGTPNLIAATNRALRPYVPIPEVFWCPADRGMDLGPDSVPFNNIFRVIGNSYAYNFNQWWKTKQTPADRAKGLAEKPLSWVPEPSRFILLFEPPALPMQRNSGGYGGSDNLYFLRHFNHGSSTVHSPQTSGKRWFRQSCSWTGTWRCVTSPAASGLLGPPEPTANCIWYKPASE